MIPELPASSLWAELAFRAKRVAVRMFKVPAEKCGLSRDVLLSAGKLRVSLYVFTLSSTNRWRRSRASCSPAGQKEAKRFRSSAGRDLLGGADGIVLLSKSCLKFFRVDVGLVDGRGDSASRCGWSWTCLVHAL